MQGSRNIRQILERRRPFLRLAVVGAGLLIAASMLPLIWRTTHTLEACMTVTESYLKGESLRDFAFHLNDVLAHDAATAVHRPDLLDFERRDLLVAQLHDRLLIAKLVRQACHAKCALDRADSLQVVLRANEAVAIDLARAGRQDEALARLNAGDHREVTNGFVAALDEYARDFKRDVNEAVAAERRQERAAVAWVGLILVISVSLWFVLLRTVEAWKRRVLTEMEERERARRDLRASLERYRDLFKQVQDAILVVDRESGRILDTNPAACEMLGYPRDQLLESTMQDLEADSTAAATAAKPVAVMSPDQVMVEREYRHRSGKTLLLEVSRRRVTDRGREALLCLARDITRRRALEAHLAQAQQLECVGRLAAGIAHDLGNTLLAISAYAQVLRRTRDVADEEANALGCIDAALEQATTVIKSMLSFAAHSVVNPRQVDAATVYSDGVRFIEPILPAKTRLEVGPLPGRPLWILADPDRLHQALLNLVLNACDAMPDGGTVRLDLDVEASAEGGPPTHVAISVADTGPGIPPEIRDRIGDPFVTTKPSHGVGLGLFNVRRVMDECDGRVEVTSPPAGGATLRLLVPLLAAPAEVSPCNGTPAAERSRDVLVLVAERDDFAREVMAEALQAAGLRVRAVATLDELAAALDREPVGLVIVDSQLQDGAGVDYAMRRRREDSGPPVIVVLGRALGEVEQPIDEGTLVLTRPFTVTALCRLAATAIDESRSGEEALS